MEKAKFISLAQLNILDPKTTVFSPSDGGYLNMTADGTEYKKIKLSRALPHKRPNEYISVIDRDKGELGIILNIEDFSEEQRALINGELAKLYYSPRIVRIISKKDKMGFVYMEVETTSGLKEFALRDPARNIRYMDPSSGKAVQITDVDGNRYLIEDFAALDAKSAKKIEAYLV